MSLLQLQSWSGRLTFFNEQEIRGKAGAHALPAGASSTKPLVRALQSNIFKVYRSKQLQPLGKARTLFSGHESQSWAKASSRFLSPLLASPRPNILRMSVISKSAWKRLQRLSEAIQILHDFLHDRCTHLFAPLICCWHILLPFSLTMVDRISIRINIHH